MRPQSSGPWRKTLRAEAKGEKRPRFRASEPDSIRPRSTWLRRHSWMPQEEKWAVYAERCLSRNSIYAGSN